MDVISWVLIIAIAAVCIGAIIAITVKIKKMTPEERKMVLIVYLKGAVAWAEKEIVEHGKGAEKLEKVEEYFESNASWFLKLLLKIMGKDSLVELIEIALKEVKDSFGK